jgi:hypothetical protein
MVTQVPSGFGSVDFVVITVGTNDIARLGYVDMPAGTSDHAFLSRAIWDAVYGMVVGGQLRGPIG